MESLIILLILCVLSKGKSGGSLGGSQIVTPDPPPDPVDCDNWGTAVPNWQGSR